MRYGVTMFMTDQTIGPVELAREIQDWLPEQSEAWGEARPPCPGHPHPLEADLLEGEAWWVCPGDERPVARVGELGRG